MVTTATRSIAEPIRPGELYQLDTAMDRLGWGRHAMRQARRNGLPTIQQGSRVYVLSDDVLKYFKGLKNSDSKQKG